MLKSTVDASRGDLISPDLALIRNVCRRYRLRGLDELIAEAQA